MLLIPDSLTHSTEGIAGYINASFTNQGNKARAIFVWIANNILYDLENEYSFIYFKDSREAVDIVLKTKKGVCTNYAELFTAIANQVGIKSYVISGLSKQNGTIDSNSHAWCAANIDSAWYLFDPTWGSGNIRNAKYIKKLNNLYFKTKPEEFIKTHMPFDPLWQFLNYPLTTRDFYQGKDSINKIKPYFNYRDTLYKFEHDTEIEKWVSCAKRIEGNGVINMIILERLNDVKKKIDYFTNKMVMEQYFESEKLYNEGIKQFNRFVEYRNQQFTPEMPDKLITQMIDSAEYFFNNSKFKLREIKHPNSSMVTAIIELDWTNDDALVNLKEHKVFLERYLQTDKTLRKALFYKHIWMGKTLN